MEPNHRKDELIRFSPKDWEEESVWELACTPTAAKEEIAGGEMRKQRRKKNDSENWKNKKIKKKTNI